MASFRATCQAGAQGIETGKRRKPAVSRYWELKSRTHITRYPYYQGRCAGHVPRPRAWEEDDRTRKDPRDSLGRSP